MPPVIATPVFDGPGVLATVKPSDCPLTPFSRIKVDYTVAGGARISWDISESFIEPGPYIFQLQVGHTGLDCADDWEDVGLPMNDVFFIVDTEKRLFGKMPEVHYRIKFTSSLNTYYSQTASMLGQLDERDGLLVQEIIRKENLRHISQVSARGFLLKARRYGPICTDCTDPLTQEVTSSSCSNCYGTEHIGGYFCPVVFYADLSTTGAREHLNPQTGTERQFVIKARFVNAPQLYSYDVWVNATSDERYYLHTINILGQVRGVPVVLEAEMRLAPFTDPIYTLFIPKHNDLLAPQNQTC